MFFKCNGNVIEEREDILNTSLQNRKLFNLFQGFVDNRNINPLFEKYDLELEYNYNGYKFVFRNKDNIYELRKGDNVIIKYENGNTFLKGVWYEGYFTKSILYSFLPLEFINDVVNLPSSIDYIIKTNESNNKVFLEFDNSNISIHFKSKITQSSRFALEVYRRLDRECFKYDINIFNNEIYFSNKSLDLIDEHDKILFLRVYKECLLSM